jgi:hypothetical protein
MAKNQEKELQRIKERNLEIEREYREKLLSSVIAYNFDNEILSKIGDSRRIFVIDNPPIVIKAGDTFLL